MARDPRAIRRANDLIGVTKICNESSGRIRLVTTAGDPPTTYTMEYHCRSWALSASGERVIRETHRIRIDLPDDYPDPYSGEPEVFMLDPVWNIHVWSSNKVCLGDWYPCPLADLVVNIGKLLVLDPVVLNFGSPANSDAGEWAEEHLAELPLEHIDWRPSQMPRPRVVWGVTDELE
jgi:hypothetical protein